MNDTINTIMKRKSVRAFTDRTISDADKELILNSAFRAPTAGNQQLYTIIDVTDEELKKRLVPLCDDQDFIADAKMVLIFLADCLKWYDAYKSVGASPREPAIGDLMLAVSDANIAAQNAVIAAESLGIGSCYIGDIMENCEKLRETLDLPKYVFPAAMLVFGYPTAGCESRKPIARIDANYTVHKNRYNRLSDEELRSALEWKSGKLSYEEWLTAFCNRKYNSDLSREMSRSVGIYLKDFKF